MSVEDPRVLELRFLTALDRAGLTVKGAGVPEPHADMVLHLLREGLIASGEMITPSEGSSLPIAHRVERANDRAYGRLLSGAQALVVITHAGRVHMWRLRDELRTNRDREPFNILYTRAAFDRELAALLPFVAPTSPLSLLFLDLDHFKAVNDTLGHPEGDRALQSFFQAVLDVVAGAGEVFRYGGDEVTVVLASTPPERAVATAERICSRVRECLSGFKVGDRTPTTSIGVATFTAVVSPTDAINAADARLLEAKRLGRDRVHSETPVTSAPPC